MDLPEGYSSSANPEAPDLSYKLPYKHRKAIISGHRINVSTPFRYSFRAYNLITIDYNQNDTLNIGSGSNEVYRLSYNQMYMEKTTTCFPLLSWEIDFGNWRTSTPMEIGFACDLPKNMSRNKL